MTDENNFTVFGHAEEKTLDQMRGVVRHAAYGALMADNHFGYVMPIGGVAAYRNQVSVVGVGFDIACGNCAIRTNLAAHSGCLTSGLGRIYMNEVADEIANTISFGVGRTNKADDAPINHSLFESPVWDALPANVRDNLREKARAQLGTVGSGNHYVDVFADTQNHIWVGVHFGSRGLGHTIASGFLALSQNLQWGTRAKEVEVLLDLDSPIGQDYWALMNLAGQYAYAGREWVARKVVNLLGASETDLVHNHHNFAWHEEHFGEEYVVVRKGATPAFPGQRGFVGGSMGDDSVILKGALSINREIVQQQQSTLYSTVHGAGRVMSRNEARGKIKGWGRKARIIAPGKISQEMMDDWMKGKGVILRGGGLDESPHVYRRLPDVLEAQGKTIEETETLRPLIVCMAGANEFDPYKD